MHTVPRERVNASYLHSNSKWSLERETSIAITCFRNACLFQGYMIGLFSMQRHSASGVRYQAWNTWLFETFCSHVYLATFHSRKDKLSVRVACLNTLNTVRTFHLCFFQKQIFDSWMTHALTLAIKFSDLNSNPFSNFLTLFQELFS